MRRCFREDGNNQRKGPGSMPPNGDVIEVMKDGYTERVDDTLRDEDGGVHSYNERSL